MSGGTRSILLRITGDPEEAKAAIDDPTQDDAARELG